MGIRFKLGLAFGIIISILIAEIILNHIVSKNASSTYHKLKSEIIPAMKVLEKYETINREFFLLSSAKVYNQDELNTKDQNRLKGIIEVEYPYLKAKINTFKNQFESSEMSSSNIIQIIASTEGLVKHMTKFDTLLVTKEDYLNPEKGSFSKALFENEFTKDYYELIYSLEQLKFDYNKHFEDYQDEFTRKLNTLSEVILWTGIVGVLLGFLITLRVVKSISKPIIGLRNAAIRVSGGNLETTVEIKGNDELASLGKSFNMMTNSLKKNIDDLELKNKHLEQFTYITSHDLQEPLRTLSSFSNLLHEQYESALDETGKKSLEYIRNAAIRMRDLVTGLLEHSRIGNKKSKTLVKCQSVIDELKEDLAVVIQDKKAIIETSELPEIEAFPMEIKMLFQNLITNGLKFQKENTNPKILIGVTEEEAFWKFAVKDNGIGIKKEFQERIFAIFQRLHAKDTYEGTGIGLSHCQKIVDLHHGKIWVESIPEEGSTFYFTIKK